jgi:hypothetical protein
MKYITPEGVEITLASVRDCVAAIRAGKLTPSTMVFDEESGRWLPASKHADASALFGLGSNSEDIAKPSKRASTIRWAVWISAFLAPVALALFMRVNVGYAFGEAVGCFIWVMAITGIVHLVRKIRKKPRPTPGLVPAAAVATMLLAVLIVLPEGLKHLDDHRAAVNSAKALNKTIDSFSAEVTSSTTAPATAGAQPQQDKPHVQGSAQAPSQQATAALLMDAIRESFDEMARIRQDEIKATEMLMPATLLTPETLTNESKLRASDARIKTYEVALERYEKAVNDWYPNVEAKVRALAISDADKAGFMESFHDNKGKQLLDEYVQVERSIMKETKALHAFAEDRMGQLTISDNRLMFVTNADLDYYNSEFAKINKLAERESSVTARSTKMMADGKEKLKAAISTMTDGSP